MEEGVPLSVKVRISSTIPREAPGAWRPSPFWGAGDIGIETTLIISGSGSVVSVGKSEEKTGNRLDNRAGGEPSVVLHEEKKARQSSNKRAPMLGLKRRGRDK
jgi:hypothetical protein